MSVFIVTNPAVPGENTIQPQADNVEGLIIKGHSPAQTADWLRLETSAGEARALFNDTDDAPVWAVGNDPDLETIQSAFENEGAGEAIVSSGVSGNGTGFAAVGVVDPVTKTGVSTITFYTRNAAAPQQLQPIFALNARQTQTDGGVVSAGSLILLDNTFAVRLNYDADLAAWFIGGAGVADSPINTVSGGTLKAGFLGAAAVARQVGASAAAIAAIVDPNAKAAISALQTALANLGLVTSPP